MDTEELFRQGVELSRMAAKHDPVVRDCRRREKVIPLTEEIQELPLKARVLLLENLVQEIALQISPLKKEIEELRRKIG